MSVGTKLWTGVALIILALLGTIASAGLRSARMGEASERTLTLLADKTALAVEWAGLTETTTARVQATTVSSDPAMAEMFKQPITDGMARISELQKRLQEMEKTEAELAALARIGELRKDVLQKLAQVNKLKADEDYAGAAQAMRTVFNPAVGPYLAAVRDFGHMQADILKQAQAEQAKERASSIVVAATQVGLLVLAIAVGAFFLIRNIRQPLNETMAFAERMAAGDLTATLNNDRGDEFGAMTRALGTMRDRLVSVVADVKRGTENITVAAKEISTGNNDLSSRTEQTASNLQQTAASMEQMSGAIKQSADSARVANQLADVAGQSAQKGGSVVNQVVSTMEEINQASRKINDIIGVIDGIAFQTNILALNAAVEAARAGEQGRGFAVVAGEVRNLAQRSAQAAKEIKGLIGASVDKVTVGTELVNQAGQTMSEIVENVVRVRDIIGEIASASGEQAEGVNQINAAVSNLDQMTQQNAALVEESAAAASSMNDQAARLAEVVRIFRLDGGAASAGGIAALTAGDLQQRREPALLAASKPAPVAKPVAAATRPAAPTAKPVSAPVAAPAKAVAPAKAAPPVLSAKASGDDAIGEWESF
ncbi:MAG: HAMP domain-containing protein [Hydrogenophaga sp.]|nr:HAMP domain-containing protein [Hydrogenophaga sp.]NIN28391.1 HAMP domain-containing protein [Hydrogenophaga sp.]NIN29210.1 HAMP domain-containing protein [Hydrogenophaga sp.]NIN57525.1 HAMP domain-containing protein [Hydrogenophaga sp.]NIO53820.1 HAMP domain-containing protein [Hydrogenophaga sp.]